MGAGHVMRGLALAEAWQAAGGRAELLGHGLTQPLRERVEAAGVAARPLALRHPDAADLQATLRRLGEVGSQDGDRPWLALDGYHFDPGYQQAARAAGCRVLVIDDLANLSRYHADLLVNPNLGAERLTYESDADSLYLLGSRYALLRSEFLRRRDGARPIAPTATKLLITLGGGDAANRTARVTGALGHLDVDGVEAVVVVGASNPHRGALESAARASPVPLRLVDNPADMAALMAEADVAVAAAGGTAWELACMGLPSILVAVAENQRPVARGMAAAGAALDLGEWDDGTPAALVEALATLCRDPAARRAMSERGRELIDGRGALRVASLMRALDAPALGPDRVRVRPAEPADAVVVWRLANEPSVRAHSFDPRPIPLEGHMRWYRARLASPDCRFWLLEVEGVPVAQVRYDRVDETAAEVSFAVAPALRGRGVGTLALERTCADACVELRVGVVRGAVIAANEASARAFVKAGFRRAAETERNGRRCYIFERTCA